jgi:hypothetical protein
MRWNSAFPCPSGSDWALPETAKLKITIDPRLEMHLDLYAISIG